MIRVGCLYRARDEFIRPPYNFGPNHEIVMVNGAIINHEEGVARSFYSIDREAVLNKLNFVEVIERDLEKMEEGTILKRLLEIYVNSKVC